MTDVANDRACKQKGCQYPIGGDCMEGLDPESCPHASHVSPSQLELEGVEQQPRPEDTPEEKGADSVPEEEEGVLLFPGNALPLADTFTVAQAHEARLVVLLGEKGSGKTTLLAELYQKFLRGPFAGCLFTESKTLPGFEERCYLARTSSGRERSHTERTKSGAISLVHLAVRPEELTSPACHLLLTDMSGEYVRQMRSSEDEAQELRPLLRRADRVVFVVDGERLTAPASRQQTVANARMHFRALLEIDAIGQTTPVDHVVTKWDCVSAVANGDEIVSALETRIEEGNGDKVGQLAFHRVSARVEQRVDVEPGMGLADLLTGWRAARIKPIRPAEAPMPQRARSFLRFENNGAARESREAPSE